MKTVPEMLREAAEIYEQRSKVYGDNYKHFGYAMAAIFQQKPVVLTTPDDHNRFGVLVQAVSKITRYAQNFSSGGHKDSLDDAAVYAMMLQELDESLAQKREAEDLESGEK